jgi:hypothetical protein
MKVLYISIIIILGISIFSFADDFLKENLPESFWLVDKNQSASIIETVNSPSLGSKTDNSSENSDIPKEETKEPEITISPYINTVKVSSVNPENSSHVSLITLSVRPKQGQTINLNNWTIETRRGKTTFPKAMEYYSNNYNPKNVIINESTNIYLIGSTSPLGSNRSFKLNKCFGYLSQTKNFYPNISKSCPSLKLEQISFLTPICQDFILKQSNCKMPNYSAEFKVSTDNQCVSYILDYFTYNGCSKMYSNDENFLKNYWYLYLERNIVEPLHDTIYIYDEYDLLVSEYIY